MSNFDKWDRLFRAQKMNVFNDDTNGLLWLKVRAVCRGKQLKSFLETNQITLQSQRIADRNIELFEYLEHKEGAMAMLDTFLGNLNNEWYNAQNVDIEKLKSDLYKVKDYSWGGDQNNSLDKYFVSRYVKVISEFDKLESSKEGIANNAWNYVQVSWYNNWTSFLIESLFKRHAQVVSAVGAIKSVDFFIGGYPIDLKVTFFPTQFMDGRMKEKLGKKELSWLKQQAKEQGISVDTHQPESMQMYTLREKLSAAGHQSILDTLASYRKQIVNEAQAAPAELITWLYENQGEMRFGAENRLFLVLVDSVRIDESWKLKRAYELIEPKVTDYLAHFSAETLKKIHFTYKGTEYHTLSDIIFVVK